MGTFQIDFGEAAQPERIIGIDLGTTNSLAAFMDLTGPEIIAAPDGARIVPSVVALLEDGSLIAGNAAKARLVQHPDETLYSTKRFMDRASSPLKIGNRELTPPEAGARILLELKNNAEAFFNETITKAVVTVPAYFNDAQRQATKDAGRIAGLDILRLVNEPTAAALAYGLDKRNSGTIAVYDFGGGTFDISILKIQDGIFEVLATNGDTHLGGDDIDQLLIQIALEDIATEWGAPINNDTAAVETLRQAVIKAKEQLSFALFTGIDLEYNGKRYQREVTRDLLERLIAPLIERTLAPCRLCLADARLTHEDIDEVVLVGGSTRIPMVRKAVEKLFRSKPHTDLNPDEVVALGAAIQAGILSGEVKDTLLLDVTPLSLGLETMGGVVTKLIHRNSTIPASETEHFTTAVDGQTNVLIHVLQGERELVKDCRSLARFELTGIEPVPAGLARIEVKFLIDANGILNVSAKDTRTGKEQSVEVKPSYGLTDEQVEAMILESLTNAESDIRERQVREARVESDRILGALESAKQSDAWFELPEEDKAAIEIAHNELLLAYHGDDHRLIQAHMDKLDKASLKLAENMMNSAVRGALKGTKI